MAWDFGNDLNQTGGITPAMLNFSANAGTPTNIAPQAANQGIGSWFGGLGQMGGGSGSAGLLGLGQLGLQGIGTIGNLWTAMGALDLAKQQFGFNKGLAQTNLANSAQSYNTALADKADARYFTEGKPQSAADAYIAANKVKGTI